MKSKHVNRLYVWPSMQFSSVALKRSWVWHYCSMSTSDVHFWLDDQDWKTCILVSIQNVVSNELCDAFTRKCQTENIMIRRWLLFLSDYIEEKIVLKASRRRRGKKRRYSACGSGRPLITGLGSTIPRGILLSVLIKSHTNAAIYHWCNIIEFTLFNSSVVTLW